MMAVVATVKLYDDVMYLHCLARFHPDHIQEFLTKRKRKSEGWKCAVRITFGHIMLIIFYLIMQAENKPQISLKYDHECMWTVQICTHIQIR